MKPLTEEYLDSLTQVEVLQLVKNGNNSLNESVVLTEADRSKD